jgi:hypothetical protein
VGPFLGSTPVDAPAVCVICFTFTMKMQNGRKVTKPSRKINGVSQLALIYLRMMKNNGEAETVLGFSNLMNL